MTKKRNHENDKAFKNFRVQDFLPEMKWREPEAKASTTKETAIFPWMDEPEAPAMQDTVSDADRPDKPKIQDAADGETAEKNAAGDIDVPAGLSPDASAASSAGSRWRSTALLT